MSRARQSFKILFVHNNFPAQYKNVVAALLTRDGIKIAAIGAETARAPDGVELVRYRAPSANAGAHSFARRFERESRRAEYVLYAALDLKSSGFIPDLIVVHPGWGENLSLPAVFPNAKIILYCEFYYRSVGQDVDFDAEFPPMGVDGRVTVELNNAATLLGLASSVAGLSPTHWQRSTYPEEYRTKISVIHDGVDTNVARPDRSATYRLASGRVLGFEDEVVTYCARNLEPIRGFHIFMRALPRILEKRPKAQIILIGGDGVSYGQPPIADLTWKAALLRELEGRLDLDRIHFVGNVPYADYLSVLQISSTHVYLTYPFVLSWSLMEAMSAGCVIVASDTAPVREVVTSSTGVLVDFFSPDRFSQAVITALASEKKHRKLGEAAREAMIENYDAQTLCVPRVVDLLTSFLPR